MVAGGAALVFAGSDYSPQCEEQFRKPVVNHATGLSTQARRRRAAIPRRINRKIPRVSDDETSTSPKYAVKETIAKTINANAMKIDKSSEPEPCGCSFHTVRIMRTTNTKRTMKSRMPRRVPMREKYFRGRAKARPNLD
jgi:hypothetical protein